MSVDSYCVRLDIDLLYVNHFDAGLPESRTQLSFNFYNCRFSTISSYKFVFCSTTNCFFPTPTDFLPHQVDESQHVEYKMLRRAESIFIINFAIKYMVGAPLPSIDSTRPQPTVLLAPGSFHDLLTALTASPFHRPPFSMLVSMAHCTWEWMMMAVCAACSCAPTSPSASGWMTFSKPSSTSHGPCCHQSSIQLWPVLSGTPFG